MSEIIQLQIGQAGNRIGQAFWRELMIEHSLDMNGKYIGKSETDLSKIATFFNEEQ